MPISGKRKMRSIFVAGALASVLSVAASSVSAGDDPHYKIGTASGLSAPPLALSPPKAPPPVSPSLSEGPRPSAVDPYLALKAAVQTCVRFVREQARQPENFSYGMAPLWNNFDAYVSPDGYVYNNAHLVGQMDGVYLFNKCVAGQGIALQDVNR
jgi:hypothetical protein